MSTETPKTSAFEPEMVLGKAYDARLIKRLWQYVRPHWRLLLVALATMPLAVGFELAQPKLLQIAIDDYIIPGKVGGLALIALGFVALVLLQALAQFAHLFAVQLLGQRSMHDLRLATYEHVLRQRTAFFDRRPVGRLMTRMTNDVESINEMFASGVVTVVTDVIKLAAIVVMMLILDPWLTLITFATLPLLVALVDYARRLMRRSFRAIRAKLAAMNAYVQEHLSGIKVVQLFQREKAASARYDELGADYRDAYFEAIRADASMYAGVEAIGVISVALIVWYAGGSIGSGITVGLVVAFVEYVNKFFVPVRDLSAKYAVMQSAMAATERIVGLLDTHEPDAPARASADEISGGDHALSFEDVHFAYRPEEPVLRGISFDVPRGQTIAVVGATGSGKSTLIRLLTRLYEIERGHIRLDGRDVRDIAPDELRRRITVVSQDVFLFAGTVADNVRLGNQEATDQQVQRALARVGADRLLERRHSDAGEQVSERGGNFSAGERQLIAFARAIVRDPDVLVLDEATAHVDPELEELIERGLEALMRDRTTLVIAHRLSTIRSADRIVVLDRGRIAEQGTHAELMAANGLYAQLERTFSRHD